MNLKVATRRLARPRGFEIRRWDEDLSLDTFLWYLFDRCGVDTVLDVGARWGAYGNELRDNDYRGYIVSFEPVSSNFEVLGEACRQDPKWTAHRCAIGGADGEVVINVSQSTNYTSLRRMNPEAQQHLAGAEVVATETVPIRRLDGLLEEVAAHIPKPRRVYLKIDTQGWDLEVLRGAGGCLDQVVALQTEVSFIPVYEGTPTFDESRAAFAEAGFEPTALFPVARLDGWRLAEMDCVMLRRDRPFGR
jgi:FkbM family methyltransferase